MPTTTINWSQAYTHRLPSQTPLGLISGTQKQHCKQLLEENLAAQRLPFIDLPHRAELEYEIENLLPHLKGYNHMLLLGIGGSSLGAKALQKAFAPEQDEPLHVGPSLWIADNVDDACLERWLAKLPPEETIVLAISKSGNTIETVAQYFIVRQWIQNSLPHSWQQHIIVITNVTNGTLREEANRHNLASLAVPEYMGGRYSIMSAVGMLPAAYLGINYTALLEGAASLSKPLLDTPNTLFEHPSWLFAQWQYTAMQNGYDELIFFNYIPSWHAVSNWFCQLWAESIGKESKGSMPIAALGVSDQHSVNQMFLDGPRNKSCLFLSCLSSEQGLVFPADLPSTWNFLAGKHFAEILPAESLGTRMALTQHGVPLTDIQCTAVDETSLGKIMQFCMLATLFTGWLLKINPLDQPAVELGKRLANAHLGAPGYPEELSLLKKFSTDHLCKNSSTL